MERHYSKFHAFICEVERCNCVFPEARLLDLVSVSPQAIVKRTHQRCVSAFHRMPRSSGSTAKREGREDRKKPCLIRVHALILSALQFACHLQTCNRMFAAPKSRRLHLISAHGFPSQYFFAVTNKGVGGLLKKWGEGASMIRGDWKARDPEVDNGMSVDRDDEEQDESSSDEDDEAMDDAETVQGSKSDDEDELIGALGSAMGSLSLVPPSIRFGRGSNRAVTTGTRASLTKSPQEGGGVQLKAADKAEKKVEQARVDNSAARGDAGTAKTQEGAAVGQHLEEDMNDDNMETENANDEGEAGTSVGQAISAGRGGAHGGRPFMRGRGSLRGTGRGMAMRGGHRGAAPGHTERGGHANMRGGAMGMPSRGKPAAGFNPVGGQGPAPGMVPMSVIMRARGRGVALARARARAAAAFNNRGRGTS